MKIRLQAKCDDRCSIQVFDGDNRLDSEINGYPPDISGLCEGGYINLEVDLTTGVVQGLPDNITIMYAVRQKEANDKLKQEQADKRKSQFKFNTYG